MNDLKLPLKALESNLIVDIEGKQLAKIITETNKHEICECFVESINKSIILLLENEELKAKIEKLTDIIKEMEITNAHSKELIEVLQEQINMIK